MSDKRNGGVHNPRMLSNIAFTARFEMVSAIRVLTYVFQDFNFIFILNSRSLKCPLHIG